MMAILGKKVVVFGDSESLPSLVGLLPPDVLKGVVVAAIRPGSHDVGRRVAVEHSVPLLVQPKYGGPEYPGFVARLQALTPDLILVYSYSMLLREDVLSLPRFGAINVHSALLPNDRGPNPLQWAIIRGESMTGVTLHEMTIGIDEGPIIDQIEVPIAFGDSWREVRGRQEVATLELLVRNMGPLLEGAWASIPQDEAKARSNRRRTSNDGRFEWSDRVIDIYNMIRALLPPLPPAYHVDSEGTLTIFGEITTPWELASMKYGDRGGATMAAETVRLRPLRRDDGPLLYEWITDRDSAALNGPWHPVSEVDHEHWLESAMTKRTDMVVFAIETVEDGLAIGTCQLVDINWLHRSAELRIRLGEDAARGRGFGTEAVRLLADFAFIDLGLHRVALHVFATNLRAIKAYEKAGFSREGVLRDAAWIEGRWMDVVVMSTLRPEER